MPPRNFFPKVKEAREALKERAVEIMQQMLDTAQKATDAGDYETAAKIYQWLMEHMPAEEGTRIVDNSVDKQQQQIEKPSGPAIQIGIQVGGAGGRTAIIAKPVKPLPAATEGVIVDD